MPENIDFGFISAVISSILAITAFISLTRHRTTEEERRMAAFDHEMLSSRVESLSKQVELLKFYGVTDEEVKEINHKKTGFFHILQRHVDGAYLYIVVQKGHKEEPDENFAEHLMKMDELKSWWPLQKKY